jgi:hypothetical protein
MIIFTQNKIIVIEAIQQLTERNEITGTLKYRLYD